MTNAASFLRFLLCIDIVEEEDVAVIATSSLENSSDSAEAGTMLGQVQFECVVLVLTACYCNVWINTEL